MIVDAMRLVRIFGQQGQEKLRFASASEQRVYHQQRQITYARPRREIDEQLPAVQAGSSTDLAAIDLVLIVADKHERRPPAVHAPVHLDRDRDPVVTP